MKKKKKNYRNINTFCLRVEGFTVKELCSEFNISERQAWKFIKIYRKNGVLECNKKERYSDNQKIIVGNKSSYRFYIDLNKWLARILELKEKGKFDIYLNLHNYLLQKNKITVNGLSASIKVSKDKAKRLIEDLPFVSKATDKKRPYYLVDKEKMNYYFIDEPLKIFNEFLNK